MLRVYYAEPTAHCGAAKGVVKLVVLCLPLPTMYQFTLIRRDTRL